MSDATFVIVQECANGNESVGTEWLETFVCDPATTLAEIMQWKDTVVCAGGRTIITVGEVQESEE